MRFLGVLQLCSIQGSVGNERHDQAGITAGPAPAGAWEQPRIALAPRVVSAAFNAPLQPACEHPEQRRKQRRWQM